MLPIYTLGSKPEKIKQDCKSETDIKYSPVLQARPGMKMPVLVYRNEKPYWLEASWSTKKPMISMDRILSVRPYNLLIRRQRCAAPANCFFARKDGKTYLIRLIHHRLFLIGGIYLRTGDGYSFSLLQGEPPDLLNDMEGQMPILIPPDKASSWVRGVSVGKIMNYADRSGSLWYDYFQVSNKIMTAGVNDRELLKPIGVSYKQLLDHYKKQTALSFEKNRPNRSNMKR